MRKLLLNQLFGYLLAVGPLTFVLVYFRPGTVVAIAVGMCLGALCVYVVNATQKEG
jgi:hypothetical protein